MASPRQAAAAFGPWVFLAVGLAVGAAALQAQIPGKRPLRPDQLHRIAAALDGYRTGQRVWVVMDLDLPYQVDTVTPDSLRAALRADSLGSSWEAYGPFETVADEEHPRPLFFLWCHDWDSDRCNDEFRDARVQPVEGVDSIRIEFHRGGETVWQGMVDVRSVDAVFLSMPAIDKFYIPYLMSVYGIRRANEMRDELLRTLAARSVR